MKITLNKYFWEEVVKPEIIAFVQDKCGDFLMPVDAFVHMVETEYNINNESVCVDIEFLNQYQKRSPEEDYIIFNMVAERIINSEDYKYNCSTLLSCQKHFLILKGIENAFAKKGD